MDIKVLAAVPNGFKRTDDQTEIIEEVNELGYDIPEVIDVRSSLFGDFCRQHCPVFNLVWNHKCRQRDYEIEELRTRIERIEQQAIEEYNEYLVVAQLPEDAAALSETSQQISEI